MKETRLINRFSEKNSYLRKWVILGPKIVHPHKSGSAGRILLKFCPMKGTNMYMRVILIIFQKKFVLGKWAILEPKMAHLHNSGLALRIFKQFRRMKLTNRYMKSLLIVFREKRFIWGNLIFLALRPFLLFDLAWSN